MKCPRKDCDKEKKHPNDSYCSVGCCLISMAEIDMGGDPDEEEKEIT